MWIFLNDAFFSVVADRNDRGRLLVRARLQGDIERHFPEAQVQETPVADYRFRAFLPREEVAQRIEESVRSINYDNFKNSISLDDQVRKRACSDVWHIMHQVQSKDSGACKACGGEGWNLAPIEGVHDVACRACGGSGREADVFRS